MTTPEKKKIANRVLATLDSTANEIDQLKVAGKIDPRLAAQLSRNIDTFADKFEVAVFGPDNLNRRASKVRQARVIQRDGDEKYMETFENPVKPITTDADEEYMHKAKHGYNSTKDQGTYDVDRSSTVIDREEYAVRDLNEWSDGTKKQPSWSKGPAGKSTAIGSGGQPRAAAASQPQRPPAPQPNQGRPVPPVAPPSKSWAP